MNVSRRSWLSGVISLFSLNLMPKIDTPKHIGPTLMNPDWIRSPNEPLDRSLVTRLANDIRKHGMVAPILVNAKFMCIDGYHRLEAAKMLKLDTVPVRIL
jgi:hypothetical protein